MAWIEVHQTLPSHRKIKALKRELKIKTPQAVGHMVMLWLWAVDNAPDGDLSGIDPDDIAEAAEWPKDGKAFVDAMIRAGFLDEDMRLHDWGDFSGMLMEKREAKRASDRERQQRRRDRLKKEAEISGENRDSHAHVTRDNTVTSRPCHAPNSTVPYSTSYITPHPCACAPAGEEKQPQPEEQPQPELSPAMRAMAAVSGNQELGQGADPGLAKVMSFFLNRINATPSQIAIEELGEFAKVMEPDVIIAAMNYALDEHKTTWSYIRGTLRGYQGRGIRTMGDLQRANDEYERAKQRKAEDTQHASNRRNSTGRPGAAAAAPSADPIRGFHTDD